MQSASAESHAGVNAGTGRFMITLCALAAPVSIRPPRAPQLKSFTFFMSRARQDDGSERFNLHMGFFETLVEAERWAESVRRHYPGAHATIAPLTHLQNARPAASAPAGGESLTDTQVMQILGTHRSAAVAGDAHEGDRDGIALLRPEDTGTRKALKEAVVQGAPVSFAVQLLFSDQPIDLSRVRSHEAFKGHTLYATASHRKERSSYFLRLGFFPDPGSAKEVAVQVRSAFASAAVIPVLEPEITRSREAAVYSSAIPYLAERSLDQATDFDAYETRGSPRQSTPSQRASASDERGDRTRDAHDKRRMDSDLLNDSGVRHLKVEVLEQLSGRWKVIKLREAAADQAG
jgi:hypothetical protein